MGEQRTDRHEAASACNDEYLLFPDSVTKVRAIPRGVGRSHRLDGVYNGNEVSDRGASNEEIT